MDQVASKIVARMMMANLISKNDAEEYIYGVQILLEKIISYATILLLALILNRLLEIILFVVSFSLIRKYVTLVTHPYLDAPTLVFNSLRNFNHSS